MDKQLKRRSSRDVPSRRTILDPESLPTSMSRWDWLIIGLLIALLLFMPAAFGAV